MATQRLLSRCMIGLLVLFVAILAFAPEAILGENGADLHSPARQPLSGPQQARPVSDGTQMKAVLLDPIADTWIDRDYADGIYSNGQHCSVQWFMAIKYPDTKKPLLKFDVSSIPSGSTVFEARLSLHTNWYVSVPGRSLRVSVYALQRDWVESEADWRHATSSTPWQIEGADDPSDRSMTATATTNVDAVSTWFSWDITSLVHQWVNNLSPNYGIILIAPEMSVEYRFDATNNPNTNLWPELWVNFLPPPPTPTVTKTSTPTRTETRTATPTATQTWTITPTKRDTATLTATATSTQTPVSTGTPTPTPTRTATVTFTPTQTGAPTATETPVANVWGLVALQGRPPKPDPAWVLPLEVTFSGEGTFHVSTDQMGRFMVTVPPLRNYVATVKGLNTLRNVKNNVFVWPGTNEVDFGTLLAGDCNNDNTIDILDFSIFRSLFGTPTAQADFNGDGLVNIFDFSLFRSNFGRSGDIIVAIGK